MPLAWFHPFRALAPMAAWLWLALVLGGCAGIPIDPKDESVSLVFGYFDMADAPSDLEWASLKRYGEKESGWYTMDARDGVIFHIGIASGSYQVEKFGGDGGIFSRGRYEYNFGTRGRNESAIRIHKPGIYFLGAYKYIDRPGGLFKADKFQMKPIKEPSEKEVLKRLIAVLESDSDMRIYTRQIALAKKRLA
ncbi:MAG: hypothetical protein ACREIL_04920, partial [Nitrospiraceae bacterium]